MKMHTFFFILLSLCFVEANAHNVLGGVYAIGEDVEGEIGFSNGDMAAAGNVVFVRDASGAQITVVETDDEGFFAFTATQRIDHYIFSDLGSGHVFNYVLPADELPDSLGSIVTVKAVEAVLSDSDLDPHSAQLKVMIEKAVAKQIRPLRKELNEFKEKASLQDMLGGIGYIFGLCGVGIWLAQRNQKNNGAG
jgi:hypothetical protein